ncbi:MAG: SAM-dependent methyltransferase [Alphaproteobacteria bacterium]
MTTITLKAIGTVQGGRADPVDDDWMRETACIQLDESDFTAEALQGLDDFSHAEVIFHFNKVPADKITTDARHPRGNKDWPKVGIFAQRGKNRPNLMAVSVCEVVKVDGTKLYVRGLDAIDGTPVLDIKPVMTGFQPQSEIREPQWAKEIMAEYWEKA